MTRPDISVAIAVPKLKGEELFLAVRRLEDRDVKPGVWEFPSGKIEAGEKSEKAALRELEEETGLTGELVGRGDVHDRKISGDLIRFYPYLVKVDSKNVHLSLEHSSYKWVEHEAAKDLDVQDNFEQILRSVREIEGEVTLAVARKDDKYLIMKRSKRTSSSGLWSFPGGKIEEGETEDDAVLRELKEETGLNGQIVRRGESYIREGELGLWKVYPFLVEVSSKQISFNHEHEEHRWIELDELDNLQTLGSFKAIDSLELDKE